MQRINSILGTFVVSSLILAACASPTPTPDAVMDKTEEVPMLEATLTHDSATDEDSPEAPSQADAAEEVSIELPAWFGATLTDVNTGQVFTINDFKGKVILVENMAIWCTTCLAQQKQVKALHELLGMPADLVSVGLGIDPNESADQLKQYLNSQGFDWTYAIAPREVAREIGQLYGDQFLNPPSAPIFLIDRKGEVHPLPPGVKSAEDLKGYIEPLLQDSM